MGARIHRCRAEHHTQQTTLPALAGGNQAITSAISVTSFNAIDGGVNKQQAVAVFLFDFVVRKIFDGIVVILLGIILNQTSDEFREVTRGRVVLRIGHATGIHKAGVLHAEALCFAVHHRHKTGFSTTTDGFGEGNGGIVPRLHNHAFNQRFNSHRYFGVDESTRASHLVGLGGNGHGLREAQHFVLQRPKNQIGGHEFGERGGLDPAIRFLTGENLVAGHVQQEPGFGRNLWLWGQGLSVAVGVSTNKGEANSECGA